MGLAASLARAVRRPPAPQLPAPAEIAEAFHRHELFVRASAIAFRLLFTLIPFTLFLLALAGALSLDSLWTRDLAPNIAPKVSPQVYDILDSTVRKVLGSRQLFWVTAGLALALWEASAAVRAVMQSLDAIYGSRKRRSLAERLLTSAWLALATGACVVAAAAALHLGPHVVGGFLGGLARYMVAAALLWLSVGLLVRFADAAPQPLGWVTFGSTLVVVGWLITWSAYGFYVTSLADLGSAFGAFAAVIVLLTFLQLSAVVLLTGTLLDALVR
ncbi:MAG TPA: YihY/virulence factor BrkB family protein, partial [Solirubrobacteraceae bacterium]